MRPEQPERPQQPVLGVMVGMQAPPLLRALLIAATEWCYPVTCSAIEARPMPPPAAYLWCGGSAQPPAGAPYAAWVHHARDLDQPVVRGARVLLCDALDVEEAAGDRGVFVPSLAGDAQGRPVLPFARHRLRQARGLPAAVIARNEKDRWYWGAAEDPLPPDLVSTALGCASAVLTSSPAGLAAALAWAAPTVADPASAAALGARDSEHVLIGSGPETRHTLAADLVTDDARAARLGWSGWLLARRRADVRHSAWTMTRRLGVSTHPAAGRLSRLDDELDVLGTPRHSATRVRTASLVAPLPGPTSGWRDE